MPIIQLYHLHILLFFLAHHLQDLYQQIGVVSSLVSPLLLLAHSSSVYLFNHGIHLLCSHIVHYFLFSMNFCFNLDSD